MPPDSLRISLSICLRLSKHMLNDLETSLSKAINKLSPLSRGVEPSIQDHYIVKLETTSKIIESN